MDPQSVATSSADVANDVIFTERRSRADRQGDRPKFELFHGERRGTSVRHLMPAAAANEATRRDAMIIRALCAALLVGLVGDVYFAMAAGSFDHRASRRVADARSAPPSIARRFEGISARHTSTSFDIVSALRKERAQAATIVALRERVATTQARFAAESGRVAQLERDLAAARATPRIVRVVSAPAPHPFATPRSVAAAPKTETHTDGSTEMQSGGQRTEPRVALPAKAANVAPRAGLIADLASALRTGNVYDLDAEVDDEPWSLRIVQPRSRGRAFVISDTPDAPAGETYRMWVIRGANVFDLGGLPRRGAATVRLPLALERGDVLAFTREPIGTGNLPTQPVLRQFKIPR